MPSHSILPCYFDPGYVERQLELLRRSTAMKPGGILSDNRIHSETRRSEVGWPDSTMEIIRMASDAALAENEKHWRFKLDGKGEYQLTHYSDADAGAYHTHIDMDMNSGASSVRKLSFVLQLSSGGDYYGGDLTLEHAGSPDQWQARRLGTLIVFPSFVPHSVGPLVRGERWSLVGWISGPTLA